MKLLICQLLTPFLFRLDDLPCGSRITIWRGLERGESEHLPEFYRYAARMSANLRSDKPVVHLGCQRPAVGEVLRDHYRIEAVGP